MRIFLTGASGLVGAAFARAAARRGHAVTGIVGQYTGELSGLASRRSLDLGNEAAVTTALLEIFPDAIVNCAAISEPAVVDQDPAGSQALNVALPATLARVAHHLGARLIHVSSEQAFDGTQSSPYKVTDLPAPLNLYGRQKVASERIIRALAPNFGAVVRAPLLMGNSPGGRRSLHERLLADWAAGSTARLFTDEYRQPCTAENLAEVLLELCERPGLSGTLHWAGAELVSRYALGLALRDHFKLSPERAPITAIRRAKQPEASRNRQGCLALDLAPLIGALKTRPQTLAEQLAELQVPSVCQSWYLQS
jgi:dTDP-4-dehydrorhamnose reductase